MGLRFRKSFKVAPGIKINVSKSGLSTTVGKKGLSANISKRGVHINFGIPGTGISYRTKVGGKSRKQIITDDKDASHAVWYLTFFLFLSSTILISLDLNILFAVILSVPCSVFCMALSFYIEERITLNAQTAQNTSPSPRKSRKKNLQDYEVVIQKQKNAKKTALTFFETISWPEKTKWEEFLEHGEDLIQVSAHNSQCPYCSAWEGKILSLTGTTKGYPTVGDAMMDGLFHEGCRHSTALYIQEEEAL